MNLKIQTKGTLNTGAHFFVRERSLQGRLIVQQKPIKNWSDYGNNDIFTVSIVPTFLSLGNDDVEGYHKRRPYLFYVNRRLQFAAESWESALEYVEYRFDRVATPLGLAPLDLKKSFLKNEPKITFGELHKILEKIGVVLEGSE